MHPNERIKARELSIPDDTYTTEETINRLKALTEKLCLVKDRITIDHAVIEIETAIAEAVNLRVERVEAEPLLDELWDRRTDATEMRAEIERLRNDLDGSMLAYRGASYDRDRMRTERDEARRMWCEAAPVGNSLSVNDMNRRARAEAKRRGWDCFKENSND